MKVRALLLIGLEMIRELIGWHNMETRYLEERRLNNQKGQISGSIMYVYIEIVDN